jgi:hypothetical protein
VEGVGELLEVPLQILKEFLRFNVLVVDFREVKAINVGPLEDASAVNDLPKGD